MLAARKNKDWTRIELAKVENGHARQALRRIEKGVNAYNATSPAPSGGDEPEQLMTRAEVARWLNLRPKTLAN